MATVGTSDRLLRGNRWVIVAAASVLALAMVLLAASSIAQVETDDVPVPLLSRYATDLTGTVTPAQLRMLETKLKLFDDSTSTQIVVYMMPTVGQGSIEDFALALAEKNKIGRAGRDNGVLLVVAKNDRRIRIQVGYGLEGALPDALAGLIIRREIGPRFADGDFYGGLSAGVEAIMLATKNEYKADPKVKPTGDTNVVSLIILMIIVFLLIRAMSRRSGIMGGGRRSGFPGPVILFPPSGGRGGWNAGGGWGGGGRGGGGSIFSGGGGSFGGGGATGSW